MRRSSRSSATNICGSDQHMVRGRTTAPEGLILGPRDHRRGDRDRARRRVHQGGRPRIGARSTSPAAAAASASTGNTGVCLNVNPDRPGSAYGYVDMGGWVGGQAEYAVVPYADWNLLKFPDPDQALEKIRDLTMLSDIFPTGYHGAFTAGVDVGLHRLRRRRRAGRPRRRLLGAAARRGRRDRRRPDRGAPGAGALVRLRDDRRLQGRPEGADRADPRRAGGRRGGRRGRLRGARARRRLRHRGARDGAQLDHGRHPRGRRARHPGPVRDGRPRRRATMRPRSARCRSGSGSAGRSRTRSRPASAR